MKPLKRSLALLLCALCLLSALPARAEWSDGYRYTILAVIDAPSGKVHLRSQPSAKSASKGLYFTGTQVQCAVTDQASWTRVRIGEEIGYIMNDYLRTGSTMAGVTSAQPVGVASAKGGVNLRAKPSTDAAKLASLPQGSTMTVMGETKSNWYYVNTGSMLGYVMAKYVTLDSKAKAPAQSAATQTTPQNVSAQEVERAMAAYAAALRNRRQVIDSYRGKIFVGDFTQPLKWQDSSEIHYSTFALADVDADGMMEIALEFARTDQNLAYGDFAVLDYQDGNINVYFLGPRGFKNPKIDGTFSFSSSASDSGYGRLNLNHGNIAIVPYAESSMDDNGIIHYYSYNSYGSSVSEAEFDSLCNAQDSKPDVTWFPITESNISMVFGL